jgi:hypothetical protein
MLEMEFNQATRECIKSIEASMLANQGIMDLLIQAGQANDTEYKSLFNQYHDMRIKVLILKGELPRPKPKKPRFRNGLYI